MVRAWLVQGRRDPEATRKCVSARRWLVLLVIETAIALYLLGLFYFYLVHIWE
jgi:hypothetical protein